MSLNGSVTLGIVAVWLWFCWDAWWNRRSREWHNKPSGTLYSPPRMRYSWEGIHLPWYAIFQPDIHASRDEVVACLKEASVGAAVALVLIGVLALSSLI